MYDRKREEAQYHDMLRAPELIADAERYQYLTSNRKFYSITRQSKLFYQSWLIRNSPGHRVLDYGCGNAHHAILAARHGAEVVGIDVSEVSVENAKREAAREGVNDRTTFLVMDGEALDFGDSSFDIVCEAGVLHHLDLNTAMKEIARVLRPTGQVICAEALRDNPLFHLYRKLTPHLRTQWEADHILRRQDVLRSREWFEGLEMRFFHLAALAAVPLRNTLLFDPFLSALEALDNVLLRVPGLRWYAWQVIYILSKPIKGKHRSRL